MVGDRIHAYVARDWNALRAAKDDYWFARIEQLGAGEGLRAADELRRQAIIRNPSWPDPSDRQQDLLHHIRLSDLLRRAGRASRG